VQRYRRRISGPLLDRIDIQIDVPPVPAHELARMSAGESSAVIQERVVAARARMLARHRKQNARLAAAEVEKFCLPDAQGEALLKQAAARLGISARGYHRILMVARTIADLAGNDRIAAAHVAEAIQYRKLDRVPT
jgi:magnesium chelatase family protein